MAKENRKKFIQRVGGSRVVEKDAQKKKVKKKTSDKTKPTE